MKKIAVYLSLIFVATAFNGCGGKPADVNLARLMDKITERQVLSDGMDDINADSLERLYNITSAEYSQFTGKFNSVGILGDEAVIVEAVSKEAAVSVKEKMEQRYQSKLNTMEGYIPDEYEKIKKGAVTVNGNYVALLVATDQEGLNEIFKEGMRGEYQ